MTKTEDHCEAEAEGSAIVMFLPESVKQPAVCQSSPLVQHTLIGLTLTGND